MKVRTRSFVAVPLLAIALGAGAPIYADILEGQVGQNLGGTATNLLTTALPSWSFTCPTSTCVGYGISANGAATVNGASLGASSSVTVTGTPGADLLVIASSDALFSDTLTITGGTGSGVLQLTYMLEGGIGNTGTGPNSSNASLNMTAVGINSQFDGGGIGSGGYVEIDGNGTFNDTVIYYIPFTYGTAFGTELDLDASSLFVQHVVPPVGDLTPYMASVNYFNTAALTGVGVFDGATQNTGAQVGAASGLVYGPNGIVSAVPEPGSWLLFASAIGALVLAKRRGVFGATRQ